MKFCKDCKFNKLSFSDYLLELFGGEFSKCLNEEINMSQKYNNEYVVKGNYPSAMFASIAREYHCGIKEPKFFEPRK